MCGRPAGLADAVGRASGAGEARLSELLVCGTGWGGTIWRILAAPASGILACNFLHADTVPARRMNVLFVMKGPGCARHGGGRSSSRGMDGRRARNVLMDLGVRCAVGARGAC
jgi:hypothetical protein